MACSYDDCVCNAVKFLCEIGCCAPNYLVVHICEPAYVGIKVILTKDFFQLARNAAQKSECKVKIGCVIALHGKPIVAECNVEKSHPAYTANSFRETIHAEIRALIASNCDISGGIAYVYREYKNGKPALARPCGFCYNQLRKAGIKAVYYTDNKSPYWKRERVQ